MQFTLPLLAISVLKVPLILGIGAVLNMGTGIDQSRSPHNINR
jgi:hypothetical protein